MSLTASTSGFTVTCPSNSNMQTHPDNTGSQFTVKLASTLNLAGQTLNEDVQWQVALLSLHYTHDFNNFLESTTLRVIVETPHSMRAEQSASAPDLVVTDAHTIPQARTSISNSDYALLNAHVQGFNESAVNQNTAKVPSIDCDYLFAKIHLPAKFYKSIAGLYDDLLGQLNAFFLPRYGIRHRIKQSENGAISIIPSKKGTTFIYADSQYIGRILGMKSQAKTMVVEDVSSEQPTEPHEATIYDLNLEGNRKPQLDGIQALFVYANIVENQFVGDTVAPLLAYVDVSKTPGQRVGHTCDPLVYLTVDKKYIDTITIYICDEHGKPVKFPTDESVVARLHFRKCKQSVPFVF
jgi:hypothetical protein